MDTAKAFDWVLVLASCTALHATFPSSSSLESKENERSCIIHRSIFESAKRI